MTYQSEYQKSYRNRSPKKFHELSAEERKLNEVPKRSSSSPSRRRRVIPPSLNRIYSNDDDVVVIGPNDKFSTSAHYRLKQPVGVNSRVAKSQEYVVLGRNEKFENNIIYPLRNPVVNESPRVVVRQRPKERHTCGIQTETDNTTNKPHDCRCKHKSCCNKRRDVGCSEYKQKYDWKQSPSVPIDDQKQIENAELRDRRLKLLQPPANVNQTGKFNVGINTSPRLENGYHSKKQPSKKKISNSTKPFRPNAGQTNEDRKNNRKAVGPKPKKAFEAEELDDLKRRRHIENDRALTDDEDVGKNVDLSREFREKYPYGKLRRWQSEYQSTFKPFWRFDYKNGKWYKDTTADQAGFNPNLFWYKELMETRKRADEIRANAEKDHLNRDYILPSGLDENNNYRPWYTTANDSEASSVISIDPDLERERFEGERRRERDAKRKPKKPMSYNLHDQVVRPSPLKTDQTIQTDHPQDRIIYVDEVPPKVPGVATKAFVRNLSSSSVQQSMAWESQSLGSPDTDSDIFLHENPYKTDRLPNTCMPFCRTLPNQQQFRGTRTFSPLPIERKYNGFPNGHLSSEANRRPSPFKEPNRYGNCSAASNPESHDATGIPSYDTQLIDRRPYTSMNRYCTYPASRFKDEVTEFYYGKNDNPSSHQFTPASKPSLQKQVQELDEKFGSTYESRPKDDDIISVNSTRSLTSSCSLASQTFERAQENMNKYWGNRAATSNVSPKKTISRK